ncbi:hypothetical protein GH975_00235 [Litorivicinus lipolyticus]|uniref:Uroporphyrinogen-III synthase n=1 Tax=Litorivicinus lipolyticus TaxID=418701 RepID=A0A5Q2QAT1_9GAMM|nr:uroporphyrinogen-III synthase [Litorivicinus lipolyticus]QGG79067.1 hypothetical protein GH975_00235 [Litorivicinus lipolyticus]
MRVLLTRPDAELSQLADAVTRLGHTAICAPALDIQPLAFGHQAIMNIDEFDMVVVTSKPAASALVSVLDEYWPQWPEGLRVLAVGEGSGAITRAADIATQVAQPSTSEGVLAHPWLADSRRVLLVTGAGGRGLIDAELADRGIAVTRLDTYRRARVPLPPTLAEALLEPADIAWVTSVDALDAMRDWALPAGAIRNCWVPSARVADHARSLHYSSVRVLPGADNASVLAQLTKESL